MLKKISFIRRGGPIHWVGDGFPVRTVFSYNDISEQFSPFLLMDHAGPATFEPSLQKRGVGEHPHRGFETVTIVYEGEVEHRDSSKGGGTIGPGDVQWMTAASGLIHEEFHAPGFSERGGKFEMIQLWVNLPARDKKAPAGYQSITSSRIPEVILDRGTATVRVIAGSLLGNAGPAHTFSPMNVWDVAARGGGNVEFPVTEGCTSGIYVLRGRLQLGDGKTLSEGELGVFTMDGRIVGFEALEDARLLFLSGNPLNEPIVGVGPFVMNSVEEIRQAISDFESGLMGKLTGR